MLDKIINTLEIAAVSVIGLSTISILIIYLMS
jgi:hypothetical protein